MMRRRPAGSVTDADGSTGGGGNNSSSDGVGSSKKGGHHPALSSAGAGFIVAPGRVLGVVVLFIGAGFVQHAYTASRQAAHAPLLHQMPRHQHHHQPPATNHDAAVSDHHNNQDPFAGDGGAAIDGQYHGLHKQSLLTPQQDADLLVDHNTGLTYHVVFSTDCSPYQHWQSYLVYYTAMTVHQTGHVTRIASGCNDTQAQAMQAWFGSDIAFMSERFHLQLTPHFSAVKNAAGETIGDYKFFNKPFGLKYWLEHSPHLQYNAATQTFPAQVHDDIVMLIDPDMGLLRPLTADFGDDRESVITAHRRRKAQERHNADLRVKMGHPFAQVYGFGTQPWRLDLAKVTHDPHSPAINVTNQDAFLFYPNGPPYMATVLDSHRIATKWSEFVPRVHEQYPRLLAEMFAYSIAAAHEQLPFTLVDSLMISKTDMGGGEGWSLIDAIPQHEVCSFAKHIRHDKYPVPSVVHMCQRYGMGRDWFFGKRKVPHDVLTCDAPLFVEPPDDLANLYDYKWLPGGAQSKLTPRDVGRETFMICYLHQVINEAATFYKHNSCTGTPNLKKERRMVDQYRSNNDKKKDGSGPDQGDAENGAKKET